MTPLSASLLELDREACALAQICGTSDRGNRVRERVKALRRAAAEVRLADLVAHPAEIDPAEAVRLVVEAAMRAGVEFPAIVGAMNAAREDRVGE